MGFIAERANEYHWGLWFVGKLQGLVNMTIILKLFNAPTLAYFVAAPLILLGIWFLGYWVERTGLRKRIQSAAYKGVFLRSE